MLRSFKLEIGIPDIVCIGSVGISEEWFTGELECPARKNKIKLQAWRIAYPSKKLQSIKLARLKSIKLNTFGQ